MGENWHFGAWLSGPSSFLVYDYTILLLYRFSAMLLNRYTVMPICYYTGILLYLYSTIGSGFRSRAWFDLMGLRFRLEVLGSLSLCQGFGSQRVGVRSRATRRSTTGTGDRPGGSLQAKSQNPEP